MNKKIQKYCISLAVAVSLMTGLMSVSQANLLTSAAIGGEILQQFTTGKLKINKVVVEQPHIFPEDELTELLAKYEGREITADELKQIQATLSKYYFEIGYINSGIIIPNQTIKDGTIRLQAIHGRLNKIKITGNNSVSNKYIYNKIKKGITVPLNMQSLQRSLGVLRQDPLIAEVKAHLSPGDALGQSVLRLGIQEASPYYLNVETNNHQSKSIGQYRLEMDGGHRNLLGRADRLQANIGITEGLNDAGLNYALPVGFKNISLLTNFNYSRFTVLDKAFVEADVKGSSTSFGIAAAVPLIDSNALALTARTGIDFKNMTFEIFGSKEEISENGDRSAPFTIALDAVVQRAKYAAAVSAGLRLGTTLTLLGDGDTDTEYTVAAGQAYFAYQLPRRIEWISRFNGQLSNSALPTVEKFAVGGAESVRGYRENIFVRDSGYVASMQLKVPVYLSKVFAVPFIDYGRSWERSKGFVSGIFGAGAEEILSIGAGGQWNINKKFYAELFWGHTLSSVPSVNEIQQNSGIHFLLNYKIY